MSLFRWVYDALAVIGTSVLVFAGGVLIVGAASSAYQTIRFGWNKNSRPTTSSEAAAKPAAAAPAVAAARLALPIGREQARAEGIAGPQRRSLFINPFGTPMLRTRNAWVERHKRGQFLLVTRDAYFVARRAGPTVLALRLPDGSAIAMQNHTLSNGDRLAYARFCSDPPDSLVAVDLPSDSLSPTQSQECR